jgi:hypothetical protein
MSHLPPGPGWTAPAAPPQWAPPPTWAPPAGWTPGWGQPGWGQPGWGQPGWGRGWGPPRRAFRLDTSRLLPTALVASIIAAVVLGGVGLDAAIAAPSAGTVTVGGPVVMTAASGWVLSESTDTTSGVELRNADAILTAQVVSSSYVGGSASLLSVERESLDGEVVQIEYGDQRATSVNGHDTSYVVFQATVASGGRSGVIDGELICMVVEGNAVVVVVAAHQGDLDPVIDDVTAMLESVRVAP